MEVALYTRVSTPRQQQQQTIEQQLRRLRDYVTTHPDWHVADEHIEISTMVEAVAANAALGRALTGASLATGARRR